MNLVAVLRRAFAANPHTVPVGDRERATLAARGIDEPSLQTYFAWRRSLLIFVVIATLCSAGLSTFRELTETEDGLDPSAAVAAHFGLDPETLLPADEMEDDEEEDDEKPEVAVDEEALTTFGETMEYVQLAALYVLPVAALAVVAFWTRFRFTFRIMLAAFVFSFLAPMLIGLCPWSWWGYEEPTLNPKAQPLQYLELTAEGLLEGMVYLVTLLPTVLSLVPGVQRACIRVKLLLPQSMLPGWFLVVASPFYALFLLVLFVVINQLDTQPLFFVGMLLFLAAPLMYLVKARLYTRPLASDEDYRRICVVQRLVGAMTATAGALLVAYLWNSRVIGVDLLGFDYRTSLLVPLDLVEFVLETLSRSMFITVLGADLFMRMNLSAWKNTGDFLGTAEAENYDRVMGDFERIA